MHFSSNYSCIFKCLIVAVEIFFKMLSQLPTHTHTPRQHTPHTHTNYTNARSLCSKDYSILCDDCFRNELCPFTTERSYKCANKRRVCNIASNRGMKSSAHAWAFVVWKSSQNIQQRDKCGKCAWKKNENAIILDNLFSHTSKLYMYR